MSATLDPELVWLYASMWHDTGYTVLDLDDFDAEVCGQIDSLECTGRTAAFMRDEEVGNRLKELAGQVAEDARPVVPGQAAGQPQRGRRSSPTALARALEESTLSEGTHGVLSSLLLLRHGVDRLPAGSPPELKRAAELAARSILLHDRLVRNVVRRAMGHLSVDVSRQPYTALLMFLDSILEDRREHDNAPAATEFLHTLHINGTGSFEPDLNPRALPDVDVYWKLVEMTDVELSLVQPSNGLLLKYPEWLV